MPCGCGFSRHLGIRVSTVSFDADGIACPEVLQQQRFSRRLEGSSGRVTRPQEYRRKDRGQSGLRRYIWSGPRRRCKWLTREPPGAFLFTEDPLGSSQFPSNPLFPGSLFPPWFSSYQRWGLAQSVPLLRAPSPTATPSSQLCLSTFRRIARRGEIEMDPAPPDPSRGAGRGAHKALRHTPTCLRSALPLRRLRPPASPRRDLRRGCFDADQPWLKPRAGHLQSPLDADVPRSGGSHSSKILTSFFQYKKNEYFLLFLLFSFTYVPSINHDKNFFSWLKKRWPILFFLIVMLKIYILTLGLSHCR